MSLTWERSPIAESPVTIAVLPRPGRAELTRSTLQSAWEAGKKHTSGFEILFPGTSAELQPLRQAAAELTNVRLLEEPQPLAGDGVALRACIKAATHPLIFTLPVGYNAASLSPFLAEIDLVDMVCGVRKHRIKRWRWRQFFSSSYHLFGLWLKDPQCPVRLYRKELFDRLPLQSDGAFVHIEILAKANFQSKLLSETEIDGPEDAPAESKRDFWRVLRDPDFGPAPEKTGQPEHKPIFTTPAPAIPGQD